MNRVERMESAQASGKIEPCFPDHLNSDFYDLSNIRPEWRRRPSVIASNIIFSHRAHAFGDREIVARTADEIKEALPSARSAHQARQSASHFDGDSMPIAWNGSKASGVHHSYRELGDGWRLDADALAVLHGKRGRFGLVGSRARAAIVSSRTTLG